MTATRSTIRFYLDDELVELRDVDPTRTVLEWLREDRVRTGTKEGCAEGDCGACAVVVAELDAGDEVKWRALNSCIQFLPTLDGKQLVTVESLQDETGVLHPVQEAMVACHGSQCGFCTPGFVMSLYALYRTQQHATRVEIDDALAGNLCRCTGYRPIVAAAQRMYALDSAHEPRWADARSIAERLRELRDQPALAYRAGGKRYAAPRDVATLAALLERHPEYRILAGGTDVGLWVTKDYAELDSLVYTGNVSELRRVERSQTHLEIGAAVTFTDALTALLEAYPELHELLLRFAGPPIRNAATLAGNIANGSPIGDSMPALIALGTELVLRKGEQRRVLALDEFYRGYRETALAPGEFVEWVAVPLPTAKQRLRTYKISKRFDQDISAVCAAFCVWIDDGVVADARVAFGGVAATPARARQCEAALRDQPWDQATLEVALAALDRDFEPISDMRASDTYRRRVSRNLLRKFFAEREAGDSPMSVYEYGR